MQGGWGKSAAKDFTITRSNKISVNIKYYCRLSCPEIVPGNYLSNTKLNVLSILF